MAHTLPSAAHGDSLYITKIEPKYEGRGDARHIIGTEIVVMLLFDHCTPVPIVIRGLDAATLPDDRVVTERNMSKNFLIGRFKDLVITYRGGEYGSVVYSGTASGVEISNLTPPASAAGNSKT